MFAKLMIAFLLIATAAEAAPPTDTELLFDRAQAAEAQVKYLSSLILRIQEQEKETAAYWARYIEK